MIFDFEWKTGLVFGLEYEEILVVNEEDEKEVEGVHNAINLHLGIATLCVMFKQK